MTTQTLTLQLIINRLQPLEDPRLWVEQCLNFNTNHVTVKVTDLGNIDPTVPNPVRVAARMLAERDEAVSALASKIVEWDDRGRANIHLIAALAEAREQRDHALFELSPPGVTRARLERWLFFQLLDAARALPPLGGSPSAADTARFNLAVEAMATFFEEHQCPPKS